jgi:hypothetical protein
MCLITISSVAKWRKRQMNDVEEGCDLQREVDVSTEAGIHTESHSQGLFCC